MNEARYKDIVNKIIKQAPMECGVQSLVYMMLYDIIREKYKDNEVSIIIADLRNKLSIFGGAGGVVDLCVVSKEFEYKPIPLENSDDIEKFGNEKVVRMLKKYDYWEKELNEESNLSMDARIRQRKENLKKWNDELKNEFETNKKRRLGCVEIKSVNIDLPDNIWQLAGHIIEYKRVLYTNGLKWQFFDFTSLEECDKNEFESLFKKYDKMLDKKNQCTQQDIIKVSEELRKKIYIEDGLKKWQIELGKNNQFVEDYKNLFIKLKNNISGIKWEKI